MNLHIDYRPKDFDEVFGNKGVVESLSKVLKTSTIPHAILFVGGSGCGKTTLARIIGNYLDCDDNEFYEINAANNRGIDFIRDIISSARYKPLRGTNKVYLFDEFHASTSDAQNALLKLIEDAPSHAYFIFCSTIPDKILKTIQTRCYRYDMRRLSEPDTFDLIDYVSKKEGLKIREEIKEVIVMSCEGVPRTALIMLGMLANVSDVDTAIDIVYKEIFSSEVLDLCRVIMKGDWQSIVKIFKGLAGKQDYEKMRLAILGYLSSCLSNAKTVKDIIYFTALIEVFIENINYNSGKSDFLLRLSQAYLLTCNKS